MASNLQRGRLFFRGRAEHVRADGADAHDGHSHIEHHRHDQRRDDGPWDRRARLTHLLPEGGDAAIACIRYEHECRGIEKRPKAALAPGCFEETSEVGRSAGEGRGGACDHEKSQGAQRDRHDGDIRDVGTADACVYDGSERGDASEAHGHEPSVGVEPERTKEIP
jgi:hypothetical protein